MQKKLVTAIITTYQREPETILRAIKSVQNQTYSNIEIILVDDNKNGSEYSKKIRKAINEKEVTYIKQKGNQGACAARNLGIELAYGTYIGFLDDDDEWLPKKIEKQIEIFEKEPELGMVSCSGYTVDSTGGKEEKKEYMEKVKKILYPTTGTLLHEDTIGSTSQPLIKKECFKICGGFAKNLPARQDYEMWIRISLKYKIKHIDDKLFLHYIYDGEQITKSPKKAAEGYLYVYQHYKYLYKNIPEDKDMILSKIVWYQKRYHHLAFLKYTCLRLPYQIKKKVGLL